MEYYHYASPLARTYWYHVLAIGRAKLDPGYVFRAEPGAGLLLHYMRAGRIEHQVAGQRCDTRPGMVCLIDRSHGFITRNCTQQPAEVWWVAFDGRDLPHLFTELRADREPLFKVADRALMESTFERLIDLVRTRAPGHEPREFAALAALLAELFVVRDYEQLPAPGKIFPTSKTSGLTSGGGGLSDAVRKSIDYVARGYRRQLTLNHLADAAGLSVRQFSRVFRSEMGLTPMQYLRRYRVERACVLLETSDYPMEQIADLVGANTQSHFAYLFRQTVGYSPSAHRAAAREAEV